MQNTLIIDAHSHLWLKQDAVWNGMRVKTLENGREAFAKLPLAGQCRTLREILKFFRCDMQHPDLKSIGGPGTAGVIMKNKEITAWQSAYLLHQSPAGLYRRRVDLKTVGNKA